MIARHHGAEVPFIRPPELGHDSVHSVHVVLHALEWFAKHENYFPYGILMLLPTSPFRSSKNIADCVDLFINKNADSVISVVDTGKYIANMRYIDNGVLKNVMHSSGINYQRQGQKQIFAVMDLSILLNLLF